MSSSKQKRSSSVEKKTRSSSRDDIDRGSSGNRKKKSDSKTKKVSIDTSQNSKRRSSSRSKSPQKSRLSDNSSRLDDIKPSSDVNLPYEVITGQLLTHYDETAGVALPHSSVEQHRTLGNTVIPLVESYKARYERLRTLLTTKLFPKRENLLQLRRQLLNTSTEVAAVRKGIERETMKDAEQIIERLRAVESLRQSSIQLQVLQLDEEIESIERLTKRVKQAKEDSNNPILTSGVTLTSAIPGSATVEPIRSPRAALMVELIQQFADLSANIEKLSIKPMTIQIDFPIDDFPKETSDRLEIISRCDRYTHAINVKDHMLWTAIQEKKAIEEKLEEERVLSHEYAKEVAKWAEVTNTMSMELNNLKMDNELLNDQNRQMMDIMRKHNLYFVNDYQER